MTFSGIIFARRIIMLVLFVLPLQTRWIFGSVTIGGEASEYGVLSLYAVEVFILIAAALLGRPRLVQGSQRFVQSLFVFLAAGFFSLTFSDVYSVSLVFLLHVIVASIFVTVLCDERIRIRPLVVAFLGGLSIVCVLGWIQVLVGYSLASTLLGISAQDASVGGTAVVETVQGRWLRAYGTFPHPNVFGGYLAVGLIVLAWLVRSCDRVHLPLLIAPTVLLSSTLILTFSRGAWLGLTVSLLLLGGFMLYRRRRPPRHVLSFMAVGLFTILLTVGVFHNRVFARFDTSLRVEAISIEERSSQYASVGEVFQRSPIIGVGPGGYVFALSMLTPGRPAWSYQPIHNALLLVLSELGVVGAVALLYLMIRLDQVSSRVSKTVGGMFALTLSTCLLLLSLFDHYPWSLWSGLVLYAFAFGLIVRWSVE